MAMWKVEEMFKISEFQNSQNLILYNGTSSWAQRWRF